MKLIVGLGNPGQEYVRTRHNAGFMALDRLAARHAHGEIARSRFGGLCVEARIERRGEPGSERALLLKPMTYMNRSGGAVGEAVRFYKLDPAADVLVLVDDVALDCGTIRLRASGSPGGHNGLTDIERALGTSDYARLRIGIGPKGRAEQVGFVLGRFTDEQMETLAPALEKAADASEEWALSGVDSAMNTFNVRPARERADTGDTKTEAGDDGASAPASPEQNDRTTEGN